MAAARGHACRLVRGARQGLRSGGSMGEVLHAAAAVTKGGVWEVSTRQEEEAMSGLGCAWAAAHGGRLQVTGVQPHSLDTQPSAAAAAGCSLAASVAEHCIA